MNAPAPSAALAHPTIEMLLIGAIRPSGTHIQALRRSRFDAKLIQELAESMKPPVGVLQPILVRPLNGGHEIVAGERRWLAAKEAGLTEIPATVRELTDEQVLEVQLIENLQREGLHELEEAEGYEELMKLKKINADAVADMVGRSRSYVFKRTKLLALCPEARKAFYGGLLDASKALLIARIGHHDTQRAALKDLTESRFGDGPMSFRESQEHIQRKYMLRLKDAPFDIDDANLLPKAGACQACPKRTGNQKELFGDVKSGDVCTDPKCFDEKRQAHYAGARKALEAKGKKVLYGEAAKKVFPFWVNGSSSMGGGYVALSDNTYVSGKNCKVSAVLGEDYEPILVQHPATGKIIEAATQQAVAKALAGPGKRKTRSSSARSREAEGAPDVDEQLLERLVKLIHEKAPKEFGKAHLQVLAKRLLSHLNTRATRAPGRGAAVGAGRSPRSTAAATTAARRCRPRRLKLDVRGLTLLMFELVFLADRYHRKQMLTLFGINEAKTRELIIEERKAAAKAAREAAKKKKGAR
jgi:ParB/RepB/Spo0J family partition protein